VKIKVIKMMVEIIVTFQQQFFKQRGGASGSLNPPVETGGYSRQIPPGLFFPGFIHGHVLRSISFTINPDNPTTKITRQQR
jgi:hypothetical protein